MKRVIGMPWTFLGRLFVAGILASLAVMACAQHYQFQSYGQEQGLESLSVRSIAQDKDGLLWVATESGLYRYDGSKFLLVGKDVGAPEEPILQVVESSTGTLWVSTALQIYFRENEIFHRVNGGGKSLSLASNTRMEELPNGEMAVVSRDRIQSIQRLRNQQGQLEWVAKDFPSVHRGFPILRQINGIAADRDSIWIGCDDGLCRWHANSFLVLGKNQGVPMDTYATLLRLHSGEIWARGEKHLLRLAPGAGRWTDATAEVGGVRALASYFKALGEDPQGRLLINLAEKLGFHDSTGWHMVTESQGMPKSELSAMFSDAEGSLWLGLQGAGLARWEGYGLWEGFTQAEGLPSDAVWSLSRDGHGGILVGTNSGVAWLPERAKQFRPLAGVESLHCTIHAVSHTPDGSLWFPCGSTLYRQRHEAHKLDRYPLPAIALDMKVIDDDLWVATLIGLFEIHTINKSATLELFRPLGNQPVKQMAFGSHGVLWVTGVHGVYRLNIAQNSVTLAVPTETLQRVSALAEDRNGTLWVASEVAGAFKIQFNNNTIIRMERISKPTLHSRRINQISVDSRGWVWLSGDSGVDVLHDGHWKALNDKSGLIWNNTNDDAFLEDADGSIWIGTSGGVSHLMAPQRALQSREHSVQIVSVTVGANQLSIANPLKIPPGRGVVEVRVGTTEHDGEPDVHLKCKAPGLVDGWTDLNENMMRMLQSTPRHSVMQFQLFQGIDTPVSAVQKLEIVVQPSWWRSSWACAAYGLILCALLVLGWRLRTHKLLQKQHELEELVAERTKEIEEKNKVLESIRLELQYKATHDTLTGLLNRGALLEKLEIEMHRCWREARPLVAAVLDLDHFKHINDEYGHTSGDDVLAAMANRLRASLRDYDTSARYGGEEFVLLLPGLAEIEAAQRLDSIRKEVSAPTYLIEENELHVTASFGYAVLKSDDTVRSLLTRADKALYRAKAAGRNRVSGEE